MGAIQIEIIGSCDRSSNVNPKVQLFNDADLAYLAGFLRMVCREAGIPLITTVRWAPYPASSGNTPIRLSNAGWTAYKGWLGHQHVPGNTHGDPGLLDVPKLLKIAIGGPTPPKPDIVEEVLEVVRTDGMILAGATNRGFVVFCSDRVLGISEMETVHAWSATGVTQPKRLLTDNEFDRIANTILNNPHANVRVEDREQKVELPPVNIDLSTLDLSTLNVPVPSLNDEDMQILAAAVAENLAARLLT